MNEDNKLHVSYVNMVRIIHSASEFLFDFSHILPGDNRASIQSRVIMSPLSAKLFLKALLENMAKYESVYGEINIPGEPSLAEKLFKPLDPNKENKKIEASTNNNEALCQGIKFIIAEIA